MSANGSLSFFAARNRIWPSAIQPALAMDERGLMLGAGTCLARMASGGRLDLEADRDRLLTLLSVAKNRPMTADILAPVEAAAGHWQRGDKALANLRLVYARLPRLEDLAEADRLQCAAEVLDGGMAPRVLMKTIGLAAAGFDLRKDDPDQPRVPAGNGRESGQWGDETDGGTPVAPRPTVHRPPEPPRLPIVPVAADGPLTPGGMGVFMSPGINPLDPKGLNGELSEVEQKSIIDTVNTILGARPEDIPVLNPHLYKNYPHELTGAQLPPDVGRYITYYVRSPGSIAGVNRIIIGTNSNIYYTNNHYRSFYKVDINVVPQTK